MAAVVALLLGSALSLLLVSKGGIFRQVSGEFAPYVSPEDAISVLTDPASVQVRFQLLRLFLAMPLKFFTGLIVHEASSP